MKVKNTVTVGVAALFSASSLSLSTAFHFGSPFPFNNRPGTTLNYRNLPSLDDVSSGDFTEQVYHAALILRGLTESTKSSTSPSSVQPESTSIKAVDAENSKVVDDNTLSELLKAQLSHNDGVRGFFAAYMTGEGETTADKEKIPDVLLDALKRTNLEQLAPVACMNVIIPTAMMSVYKDKTMAANSKLVAERAARIISSLKGSINIQKNCEAIVAATTESSDQTNQSQANTKLVNFWNDVFDSYGYTLEQRKEIRIAFANII